MFVGHIACALFLRKVYGAMVPFWMLVAAVSFCDFLFVFLALAGVEIFTINYANSGLHKLQLIHAPFSHGLTSCGMISTGLTMWGLMRMEGKLKRNQRDSSLTPFALALAVPSHWFCDYIVHDADLHLGFAHAPAHGLGLWKYGYVATALELGMVAAGVAMLYKSEYSWCRHYGALLVIMQLVVEGMARAPLEVEHQPVLLLLATLTGYSILVLAAYKLTDGR